MSGLVLLAPLRLEAAALRRGAPDSDVERIGMGPGRATIARNRLMRTSQPGTTFVLCGVAGGLDATLVPGDIVVASALECRDTGDVVTLGAAEGLAQALSDAGLSVQLAPLVCTPEIVRGPEARPIAAARGARAVDMESYWCAPLAAKHRFSVVRVVLDSPAHELVSARAPRAAAAAWRSLVTVARALERVPLEVFARASRLEVGGN